MLSALEFCWWKKAGRNAAQSQHDSLLLCRLVRFVSKTSTGQLEATEINSDVLVISCEICYAPDMWLTAQRLHLCFPSVNTLQVYLFYDHRLFRRPHVTRTRIPQATL